MSAAKHSPGPFRVAPDFGGEHGMYSILDAEGCEIGTAEAWIGEARAEATANANLFAASAELLAALKEYVWGQPTTLPAGASRIAQRRLKLDNAARAAIAKAEGAKP